MIIYLSFIGGLIIGLIMLHRIFQKLCSILFHISGFLLIVFIGFQVSISDTLQYTVLSDILLSIIVAAAIILGSIFFSGIVLLILKKGINSENCYTNDSNNKDNNSLLRCFTNIGINIASIGIGFSFGYFINYDLSPLSISQSFNYLLIFFIIMIGLQSGFELRKLIHSNTKNSFSYQHIKNDIMLFMLLPLAIIFGSLISAVLIAPLLGFTLKEGLLLASPLGWQTMGGPLIMKLWGIRIGSMAFITNIFRDIISLILIPLLGRSRMHLLALTPGGVSTMDILLPTITANIGKKNILLALWIGGTCAVWAPIFIYCIVYLI